MHNSAVVLLFNVLHGIDAQPTLSTWSLDLDNNIITLNFSVPQLNPANNGMSIDCTAILIGPSAGNISMAIQLLSSIIGLQVDNFTATCDLGTEFRSMLNANPAVGTGPDNTFLYYDPSRATGNLLEDSANVMFSETVGIPATQVLPDNTPPVIVTLNLDMNTGYMNFTFSQPVNVSTWNFTDFHFQDSSNNTRIIPLSDAVIDSYSGTGRDVTLLLTLSDLNALKLLVFQQTSYINAVTLNHTSTLVEDLGGNSIALSDNNRITSLINDLTSPLVISCDLDLVSNQLTLEITEVINVTSFLVNDITIQNSISISSIMYTLTGGTLSTASSTSSTIVINLLSSDAEDIRNLGEITESTAFLSLPSTTFADLSGNFVDPIPATSALLCAPTG